MQKYCSLDANGWLIPRDGTRSRIIYDLTKSGVSPQHIAARLNMTSNSVRVMLSHMRHPRRKPGFSEKRQRKELPVKVQKSLVFLDLLREEAKVQNHV